MPESRRRKTRNDVYTPPPTRSPNKRVSPAWVGPTILALFLVGVVWLVLYYVTGGGIPGQRALGAWNLAVGFGFIVAGFGLSTQWR